MASNYTSNYQLCQWKETDKVLRAEFNADNAKIDAAIAAVDSRVDGKASSSALNSLKSKVDSLSQTVSGHTSSLAGKGDCQFYTTSYTGNGTRGESYKNSLTFPKKPMAVLIVGPDGEQITLIQGQGTHFSTRSGVSGGAMFLTWSGNTVQWYATSSVEAQLNVNGTTYRVLALLQAG